MRAGWAAALLVVALGAAVARAQMPALTGAKNDQPIAIAADNGIEWNQNKHVYIARGNATATRGADRVEADTLYAYYRPVGAAAAAADTHKSKNGKSDGFSGGSTEIYQIVADGNVHFTAPNETLTGGHAVYDVDAAGLVMTGKDLRLVTPRMTITARDSLEWYNTQQMGVARGDAIAMRDHRALRADILTARFEKQSDGASQVKRIDATGNVMVTSPGQIARGDTGVYDLDTGIATLSGHVRLTRGQNELRGRYAVVDLKNDVSQLLSAPPGTHVAGEKPQRVEGLFVPHRGAETAPQLQVPGQ